jgi:hypothetical protein
MPTTLLLTNSDSSERIPTSDAGVDFLFSLFRKKKKPTSFRPAGPMCSQEYTPICSSKAEGDASCRQLLSSRRFEMIKSGVQLVVASSFARSVAIFAASFIGFSSSLTMSNEKDLLQ